MNTIDGVVWTNGPGGLLFLGVETDRCRARLTSYGAQLCEWMPAGESPVLYVSPHAVFAAGTLLTATTILAQGSVSADGARP